jgi:hypothetical protein
LRNLSLAILVVVLMFTNLKTVRRVTCDYY